WFHRACRAETFRRARARLRAYLQRYQKDVAVPGPWLPRLSRRFHRDIRQSRRTRRLMASPGAPVTTNCTVRAVSAEGRPRANAREAPGIPASRRGGVSANLSTGGRGTDAGES